MSGKQVFRGVAGSLRWSPVAGAIDELHQEHGGLALVVSPFLSVPGVEWLLSLKWHDIVPKVICRWTASDIASGIADLDVYPRLRKRGIPLYLNAKIHLKLYVFADSTAFHGSANATARGLGLVPDGNVEVGASTILTFDDWEHIYELLERSVLVDDSVYQKAIRYQKEHGRPDSGSLPPLDLAPVDAASAVDANFSIASLPATSTPQVFAHWHSRQRDVPREDRASYAHDRRLYRVPDALTEAGCLRHLKQQFKSQPFVRAFVKLVREEGTLRFGRARAWIQETCSDKPLPYRWELSSNTRNLYEWLATFYDEVSWDRPGHSMIIRWNAAELASRSGRRKR